MVTNGYSTENDTSQVVVNGRHLMEQHEAPADGVVRAGHLVEETANGVAPHSTDGERPSRLLIAIDDRTQGMVHGDEYADGDRVKYMELAGGKVQTLLAAGENAALTDGLVSAGDGTVRVYDETTGTGEDADTQGDQALHVPGEEPANKSRAVDNTAGTEAVSVFAVVSN